MATDFDKMLEALEGTTFLPAPRVSRETMVSVLKDHTTVIQDMRGEVSGLTKAVRGLIATADQNVEIIQELKRKVVENKSAIDEIQTSIDGFRKDFADIREKISVLPDYDERIKDNRRDLEELTGKFSRFQVHLNNFIATSTEAITDVKKRTSDTEFEMKALKHYVDHFGDNLTLSSSQIIVESSAGISKKPLNLLDVVTGFHNNFLRNTVTLQDHDTRILHNADVVATKADASIISDIHSCTEELELIKEHLKREEDQGINAVRRTCEQLTIVVDGIQMSLLEKVDRNTTEMIVHQKYEDIVHYLQDALQANSQDEENFKSIANHLTDYVEQIQKSKVERVEILPMQEAIAQTESIVHKLRQALDTVRSSNDSYTRNEVDHMLSFKLDRSEAEDLKPSLMPKMKKKNRAGPMDPSASDSLLRASHDGPAAFHLEGESEESINRELLQLSEIKGIKPFEGAKWLGIQNPKGSIIDGKAMHLSSRFATTGFPVNAPGAFRQNSEGGLAGGLPHLVVSASTGNLDTSATKVRDTTFLGAANMGGGYNTHSKAMLRDPDMRPPDLRQMPDVEGDAALIRGSDGRLYYTDEGDDPSRSPAVNMKNLSVEATRVQV